MLGCKINLLLVSAGFPLSHDRRNPALTKLFYGFNSWLVLAPVIPKTLKMRVVSPCLVLTTKEGPRNFLHGTSEKHDLVQSGKSSLKSWPDVKLIPQTNKQFRALPKEGGMARLLF